jgi:hypothetical protein
MSTTVVSAPMTCARNARLRWASPTLCHVARGPA